MKNAPIVDGVPNPYFYQNRVWPSRFHGPIYTRPVFGFPVIARPQEVFTPGYNMNRSTPQPTLSGLGAVQSQWDTGQGVFKPGGYGGGVFDGDISGLGSIGSRRPARGIGLGAVSSDSYPWKAFSEDTKTLQKATNESLAKASMCPIAVDGKLGGATCGARNFLTANSTKLLGQEMLFSNPPACSDHASELVRPRSKADGCSGSSGGGLTTVTSSALPASTFSEGGMSSSSKRALGFAVGGLLALGAVVMLRRKR